ncbi:MAG: hypothetical protein WCV63_10730 [Negativicutes bacterium]|jgi:hypothetical protein
MKVKIWLIILILFQAVKDVVLYAVYATGNFALPWAVAFTAVWFVLCGLFFWFYFDTQAGRDKFLAAKNFTIALMTVIGAQLVAMSLSIAGQLLLIKSARPTIDEWEGVLAGYAGLYVYGGYATNRVINIWLQFTTNYNAQLQEWSIILVVEIMALVFIFRKLRNRQLRKL